MRPLVLTFRAKLVATHVAVALLVIAAVTLALDCSIGAHLTSQTDRRLEEQARGAVGWLTSGRHPERIASRLAPVVNARVTVIALDGSVVADSDHPLSLKPEVANQAGMPEVRAVLAGRVGRALRRDESGRDMQFVAIRATPEQVLRLGAPLSDILATLAELRKLVLIAAAIACGIALILGLAASRIGARPLRAMQRAAHRIAEGHYDIPPATHARDDFGALARDLADLARQLEAQETVRRDFVANVSHELRTPVTAIRGFAETLLTRDVPEAERREFVETIHRHSERIGRLVEDLLRLAEIEAGIPQQGTADVPLAPVVERVVKTARARAPASRAEVTIDVGDAAVNGDANGVEQILQNLVDNALRYGRADGKVAVAAAQHGQRIAVRVSDDGPGIESEHLPRLFERFYRVDRGRSRDAGGTGLGLAIAKHLTESMGGEISVESRPGTGTTFQVSLPRASAR